MTTATVECSREHGVIVEKGMIGLFLARCEHIPMCFPTCAKPDGAWLAYSGVEISAGRL